MSDNIFFENNEDKSPFQFKRKEIPADLRQKNWNGIEQQINAEHKPAKIFNLKSPVFASVAAMLLIIAGIYFFKNLGGNQIPLEYKTGYASLKRIELPDGSVVMMNANSNLRINKEWNTVNTREVWLDGEAYFTVAKKTSTHQKFVVHTSYADVEVLGTKFNVNTRRNQFMVSLEEGKIRLLINPEVKKKVNQVKSIPALEIQPGQLVKIDSVSGLHIEQEKNIQNLSGWVNNDFHFNDTPLKEIGKTIEEVYGYKMIIKDTALANRKISGDLHAEGIQDLADVLEITLRTNIKVDSKTKEFIINSQ